VSTQRGICPSNSEFNYSRIEKRPENYTGGPVRGKKRGPSLLFPLTPLHTFFGLFSARKLPRIVAKKEKGKVKKWSDEDSEVRARIGRI
jgi:hypothetical protein